MIKNLPDFRDLIIEATEFNLSLKTIDDFIRYSVYVLGLEQI